MADRPNRFVAFQVAVDSLLQFLRIKGGLGPNALGLDVGPSLDVTEFYGVQSQVVTQESFGPTGLSAFGSIASTSARRYLAVSGSVTIGAAAGTFLSLSVGFRLGSTGSTVVWITNGPFAPVVGGLYRVGADVRGLILPPQSQVILRVDGNAGGVDHTFTLEYSYQRLDGLP